MPACGPAGPLGLDQGNPQAVHSTGGRVRQVFAEAGTDLVIAPFTLQVHIADAVQSISYMVAPHVLVAVLAARRSPRHKGRVHSPGGLAAAFFPHVPAASTLARTGKIEDELRARLDAGRAAWPGIGLDPSVFMRHLAERSLAGLPPPERAADLYFACAGAHGDAAALDAFDRTFRADVARAIARTDGSPAFLDDVMQILSVKLFVRTDDGPPAIAGYGGRASLRGWLATVAKRAALNLRRRKGDQPHDEMGSGVDALGAAAGPEIALLKARYKAEFEAAIHAALAAVPRQQRTILLLHLVDGLTLPRLAAMHGVSRATVGRWLTSAREALQNETHRQLVERLRVSPSELESLAALVRSQVEVSLAALVAGGEGER